MKQPVPKTECHFFEPFSGFDNPEVLKNELDFSLDFSNYDPPEKHRLKDCRSVKSILDPEYVKSTSSYYKFQPQRRGR